MKPSTYQFKQPRSAARGKHTRYQDESPSTWVGVDGEGIGRSPHKYTYLAATTAAGEPLGAIRDWKSGLGTEEILKFLCSLPEDRRYFAYSFGYDVTKWLRDLPVESLYKLARPDTRRIEGQPQPKRVFWRGYLLQWNLTYFSVRDAEPWARDPELEEHFKFLTGQDYIDSTAFSRLMLKYDGHQEREFKVWDIWRFFGCKFITALDDWKIPVNLETMAAMKAARGQFKARDWKKIERYCQEECSALGKLAQKLTQAHTQVQIDLRNQYFGAGSTAGALLKQWKVKHIRGEQPLEMQEPIASAFFGGRFENSVVGTVPGPVYSFDISSAYPYQLTRLPCLEHATWKRTRRRQDIDGHTALVRYRLEHTTGKRPWGPFPFRLKTGEIVYPAESGGGWVWSEEYLAGERLFPGDVQFREAWVHTSNCDCRPFKDIPRLYRERVRIGKEGPGIVIKLGMNSCYGKLAQSKGEAPPYQSWVWAGLITSMTRAMILDVLKLHRNKANMLMVATDGVYSLEDLVMPTPALTGTEDLEKPLGGWERKVLPEGVFAARPGIYFPTNPTAEQLKEVRARGIGKAVLYERHAQLVAAWESKQQTCSFPPVQRFLGALTSTWVKTKGEAVEYVRDELYGEWTEHPVTVSFSGLPKREEYPDKKGRLLLRRFPLTLESTAYNKAIQSESQLSRELTDAIQAEQPDGGELFG